MNEQDWPRVRRSCKGDVLADSVRWDEARLDGCHPSSLPGVSRKTYATLAIANRAYQSQFAVVVAHCLARVARFSTIAMISENRAKSTVLSTN
jgi:hypothetical protein